jgi:hypothetical protein
MKDLRFTDSEVELLSQLLKEESLSIVWDLNAFYFNTKKETYKLECFDEHPEGSDFEYDEIFYCRFFKLEKPQKFKEADRKYWYKIISTNTTILTIEIIEITQQLPDGVVVDDKMINELTGLNKVSLGLILTTTDGMVPAFLLPSNHGFSWHDKYGFYNSSEVEELLKNEIKTYKIKSVPNHT